jgi:hypothetical protein
MTTHMNTLTQTSRSSHLPESRTVETERTRTLTLPDDADPTAQSNAPRQPLPDEPLTDRDIPADQFMPATKASGRGWGSSNLGKALGPIDRLKAFVGQDEVSLNKPPKVQLTENIWVAPSEVLAQPAWRKLWEKHTRDNLEKDAKINGLLSAGSAGLLGGTIWQALSQGHVMPALVMVAAPVIFGTQAIMKWDKLDSMKPENAPPADPEEEGSITLNPEQLEQLQQQMLVLQQAAEQGAKS